MIGYWIGWVGVALGLCVPVPQLMKIIRTGEMSNISFGTYSFLIGCMACYLIHAIYIKSPVFMVAQSINLTTNMTIWAMLFRYRLRNPKN